MHAHLPDTVPLPAVALIAGSAGAIAPLVTILGALPREFPAPIVIVQHRPTATPERLAALLAHTTRRPVQNTAAGDVMKAGTTYVAHPALHLTVSPDGRFEYADGRKIRHV